MGKTVLTSNSTLQLLQQNWMNPFYTLEYIFFCCWMQAFYHADCLDANAQACKMWLSIRWKFTFATIYLNEYFMIFPSKYFIVVRRIISKIL